MLQDPATCITHTCEDPLRTCGDESSRSSSIGRGNSFILRMARHAILVSAALCTVAIAQKACNMFAATSNLQAPVSGHSIIGAAAVLGSVTDLDWCVDTPEWANGYYKCESDGYKGVGCGPRGFTCDAYAANGLCLGGKPAKGKGWSLGEGMNYPELNCCVCGGGSSLSRNSTSTAGTRSLSSFPNTPGDNYVA